MPCDRLSKGGLQMRPTPQASPRSFARLVGLVGGFLSALPVPASAATVATDKPDYAPGQTVVITGSSWEPGETVNLLLYEDPAVALPLQLTAVADANGDFMNADFIVDVFDLGVTFTLTATGDPSGLTAETTFTDASGTCGDGHLDSGEECDLGANNNQPGFCCKNNCMFSPSSNVCRAAAGECDLAENCTGSSATCPTTDVKKASGTACSSDSNPCTLDQCDGTSNTCQHPAGNTGAACADDGNPCTLDQCNGTSTICQHPAGNAGAVCRAAADVCDAAENCTGASATCPADAKQPAGTACTADTNPCTLDQCDGTNNACQHPAGNAGATCRAAAGPCDVAETCTGTSTACPANGFLSASTVCRAATSECDAAETCTGTTATCPTDVFKSSTTPCTDEGNPCTADVCSGTSATCTHPAGNAGAACPDDGDPCTTDTCDGASTTCQHPPGNAGAVCRAAANECDVEETCPGAFIIGFRGAVSASSGTASSATSLSISRPAATQANDVMVASITAHDGSGMSGAPPTFGDPPAGWTLILNTTTNGQNLALSTYWKVAGTPGADPGPYTFTVSSSRVAGGISAYFNVDTTNPINASGGQAGSSTPSMPPITTTVYNTMLVAYFGRSDNQAIGAPSGMTERFHVETASGTSSVDAASESADASQASPGATGSKASTSHTANLSQLIALAPPSSSSG